MKFTGGLPETKCGAGSTVAFTEQLRPQLEKLFRFLEIRTLVDAPCGDFNWMSRVNISGIKYIGIDMDGDNLLSARTRPSEPWTFTPWPKMILQLDLVSNVIPKADLILCRDFFQHLPNEMILQVLHNFRKSGCEWLLATNHDGGYNEDIPTPGGFHRVDLIGVPFSLGQPFERIADGDGRSLALWSLA